ncbi:N-6 DNA methylase [Diaphorobacter aerolatus]|uniref:N-6 DNA methylase n=1 Tax=Diaphorobacter aerolatus TaxID=1288495 RepID=A0A7H0GJC1_9BURK|nr:N-6 DNA methylase [Diaphorobacter aerolatus]QNP48387.1 N-6 DNA methylase [Diaphorobacter aerolatus]
MSLNPHYAKSPTDLSVSDQEQLVEMFKTWLSLIAENEPFFDVMSSQYDQYLGEDLGQFFTPWDVSQLLGALQVAQERTPNSIHDCCVGGGSLILGQLHALYHSQGKEAIQNLYLELQDIDPHMVKLASAQVVLSSIVHQIPLSHIKVIGGMS